MFGNKYCTSVILDREQGIINMTSEEPDNLKDYELRTNNTSIAIAIGIGYNLPFISVVFRAGDPDKYTVFEIHVRAKKIKVNGDDFYKLDMEFNLPTNNKELYDYFNIIQDKQYKELYYYKASRTRKKDYDIVHVMFIINKNKINKPIINDNNGGVIGGVIGDVIGDVIGSVIGSV